tara:strand:+ start:4434 stop:4691 length:258 start_codon:yes stop_codon:yes gene_type:complete
MKIKNTEAERINSECTQVVLGEALQALDLSSIPPEKRRDAIRERLNEVMLATTTSPFERNKELFQKAAHTYGQTRRHKARSSIII